MEFSEFQETFQAALKKNSLPPLTPQQIETFWQFTVHLTEINQHTNLTAIRNVPDMITKHYIDSMLAAELLPQGARVLDLGCGP